MNNIITIGNLSYNMNFFVNSYPLENSITNIVKKYKSIGNNLNIPIILSKYNLNIYYFSNIGNDYEGKEIIKYLKQNNINISYINMINNTTTNKRYIIRNIKNNTKTILTERVNTKYTLVKDILFKPNIIYNDIYDISLLKQIKNKYKDVKIVTYLNEISTNAINVCSISDYIIIPLKYAQYLTNVKLDILNKRTIIDLYLKTKKFFSGKIVIYIEGFGSIYEKDNIVNIIPKLGDKNKISQNSFDVYIATIIYGISQYYSIDKIIKLATISKFLSDNNRQTLNIKEVIEIYEKNN